MCQFMNSNLGPLVSESTTRYQPSIRSQNAFSSRFYEDVKLGFVFNLTRLVKSLPRREIKIRLILDHFDLLI